MTTMQAPVEVIEIASPAGKPAESPSSRSPTKQTGRVRLGPLVAAAGSGVATAGSALYAAGGVPGLIAGGLAAGGATAIGVVHKVRKHRGSAARLLPARSQTVRPRSHGVGARASNGARGLGGGIGGKTGNAATRRGRAGSLLAGTGQRLKRLSGRAGRSIGLWGTSTGPKGTRSSKSARSALAGAKRSGLLGGRTGGNAAVRSGQPVRSELHSLLGRLFHGKTPRTTGGKQLSGPRSASRSRAASARFGRLGGLSRRPGIRGAVANTVRTTRKAGQRGKSVLAGVARNGQALRAATVKETPAAAAQAARNAIGRGKAKTRLGRIGRTVAGLVAAGIAAGWVAGRGLANKARSRWNKHQAARRSAPTPIRSVRKAVRTNAPTTRHRQAAVPDLVSSTNKSSTADHSPTIQGGTTMAGFRFHEITADLHTAATAYAPEDMAQVGRDLTLLPEALSNVAQALRVTMQRMQNEFPLHPHIAEIIGQVYQLQTHTVAAAEDLIPTFRALHEADLARHEAPRVNEHMWNV